ESSTLCVHVDLSTLSVEQQGGAIAETAAGLQASLDLAEGPLMRVALFACGPDKPARLLIIIHHLVVDSISWRILLEDIQLAYEQLNSGKRVQLPLKTTSFKHWAECLTIYAESPELRQELIYWLARPRAPIGRLPVDHPGGANTVASVRTVSVSLSTNETDA